MPLEISGKVSIPGDVKSGDLLIRFAVTFGGKDKAGLLYELFRRGRFRLKESCSAYHADVLNAAILSKLPAVDFKTGIPAFFCNDIKCGRISVRH